VAHRHGFTSGANALMSRKNTSQKSDPHDAQSPSRYGAPHDRAAVTEKRAQSSAMATGGSVVELHGQEARAKWNVRVHWGIIFAVVASLALWLLVRELVGLAL
jgi:hypothetical protein